LPLAPKTQPRLDFRQWQDATTICNVMHRGRIMTDERTINEVRETLATIKRLLAAQVGSDLTIAERAPLLHRLGVDRATIAAVCNTTENVVSVRVAESRRVGRGARRHSGSAKAPEADL